MQLFICSLSNFYADYKPSSVMEARGHKRSQAGAVLLLWSRESQNGKEHECLHVEWVNVNFDSVTL